MNRRINIAITIVVSLLFIGLGAMFWQSYARFGEACRDFGLSVAYYFCELFGLEYSFFPTVTQYSQAMKWQGILPSDFLGLVSSFENYFSLLTDGTNFAEYWSAVGDVLLVLAKVIAVMLPCIVLLALIIAKMYKSSNTNHNRDTVPLKIFKFIAKWTYQPIKRMALSYAAFLKEHAFIWICWLLLWAFHLNLASVVMAFFAYYFYFVLSFDVAGLYVQLCKLLIDLQVIFRLFPWWSIATVCWLLFDHWRRKIAISRLRHFEARNCGFINELPIVSMSCGSMGKKKVRPEMA